LAWALGIDEDIDFADNDFVDPEVASQHLARGGTLDNEGSCGDASFAGPGTRFETKPTDLPNHLQCHQTKVIDSDHVIILNHNILLPQ
jgi:hypothetical protein